MRRKTFAQVREEGEQRLMYIDAAFAKMRAFLGCEDWLNEWLERELPPETAIPTPEQAAAYLRTFSNAVQECMRQRAMRIAAKFRKNEPLLQATIWDGLVILACFDFDEKQIEAYRVGSLAAVRAAMEAE